MMRHPMMKKSVKRILLCGLSTAALMLSWLGTAGAQFQPDVEVVEVKEGKRAVSSVAQAQKPVLPQGKAEAPVIQLALLLDTSSSMSGLIEQAKAQLWRVVNEFIAAKQDGKTPVVQVALYEYGNNRLPAASKWIRQVQPLTRDLDKLSQGLFALRSSTVSGGNEYCGAAIFQASRSLDWHPSPTIYKAIFIAGNESFSQGPVAPIEACKDAITRGVIVNTIHCGSESVGIERGWKEGALRADGEFMFIDHNQVVAHIDAPQDEAIVRLNRQLNDTYIAFGLGADAFKANQAAQDSNAAGIAQSNLARRARTKASANYYNAAWDIVDASKESTFRWAEVDKRQLPTELQSLSTDELKDHVAKKSTERDALKAEILALTAERETYVARKRLELGRDDRSLGDAVTKVVRKQAAMKGVQFDVGGKLK